MSPPHESATSSGCGATKTWVMAGRVYRAAPSGRPPSGLEAPGADQRHEDAIAIRALGPFIAMARHDGQQLAIPGPDRDDEPTALGELLTERLRHGGRCRGDDDPVPWRPGRVAQAAIGLADLN